MTDFIDFKFGLENLTIYELGGIIGRGEYFLEYGFEDNGSESMITLEESRIGARIVSFVRKFFYTNHLSQSNKNRTTARLENKLQLGRDDRFNDFTDRQQDAWNKLWSVFTVY